LNYNRLVGSQFSSEGNMSRKRDMNPSRDFIHLSQVIGSGEHKAVPYYLAAILEKCSNKDYWLIAEPNLISFALEDTDVRAALEDFAKAQDKQYASIRKYAQKIIDKADSEAGLEASQKLT